MTVKPLEEPDTPYFALLIQDMRSVTGTIPASAAWKWAIHREQILVSRETPPGEARTRGRLGNA